MSNEIILARKQTVELVDALTSLLDVKSHYQFKIRFDNDTITIVPHAEQVVIGKRKETSHANL